MEYPTDAAETRKSFLAGLYALETHVENMADPKFGAAFGAIRKMLDKTDPDEVARAFEARAGEISWTDVAALATQAEIFASGSAATGRIARQAAELRSLLNEDGPAPKAKIGLLDRVRAFLGR